MGEHVKPVLDDIETVKEDEHCHHQARAESKEDCARIVVTINLGVKNQIVEGGDNKAETEEGVRSKPREEKGAEGEEEAKEEEQGGGQGNRINSQTDVVEQLCCQNRHSGAEVMPSETQDGEQGDGHCC